MNEWLILTKLTTVANNVIKQSYSVNVAKWEGW